MAFDGEDIFLGILGIGVAGLGIASLLTLGVDQGEPYAPSYGGNSSNDSDDVLNFVSMPSDEFINSLNNEYQEIQERLVNGYRSQDILRARQVNNYVQQEQEERQVNDSVQRRRQARRANTRARQERREGSTNDNQTESIKTDYVGAKKEFENKSKGPQIEFIYLDFSQYLNYGSKNKKDVYQEPIEEQFEKIRRKLALYGKNNITDLNRFVSICFPMVKSKYFVSLPSFDRQMETSKYYQGAECIYNMVLRPEKTGIISSVIPEELDLILVGDLVFRNNLIAFVVKGLDLIDVNVQKFGELPIECAAACAINRNDRNLPDYGINSRELYRSFLTRDMVTSLCEKVYPIDNPENAISVFEKWRRYVEFRGYFLSVQSQRNEIIESVKYINAYAVSRSDYRKNEEIYSEQLLDNNKNFIRKDQVLLSKANEDAVEFPLVRIEITKKLAEINKDMVRDRRISVYERDLRRFTRTQVALSQNNPSMEEDFDKVSNNIFLGERVAFEAENIVPNCDEIIQFFDEKVKSINSQIDNKYKGIIRVAIDAYRKKEEARLEEENKKVIDEYFDSLDRNLETDIENNTDKVIERQYHAKIKEINAKYEKQRNQLKKANKKNNKKGNDGEATTPELERIDINEANEIESISLRTWYIERNAKLKSDFKKSRILQKTKELEYLCEEKEQLLKVELADTIATEKKTYEEKLEAEKQEEIRNKYAQMTVRRFYVYFKAEDVEIDNHRSENLSKYRYLIYDNRAEKAKIDRQRKTLDSFYQGFVKNPFLASYLFVPETLGKSEHPLDELEWFSNRLNDSQKDAVKKALASNSLFLLQGPPGTGKTEVIAEITAQYVKQGKKVLVSSETHKAIDNVFDRLPKIPEIRPLRLIPSNSNKDTEYSPERLVDNLYGSISSRLDRRIQQYENFTEMKNNFSENMKALRYRYNQLLEFEKACKEVQNQKKKLQDKTGTLDSSIEERRNTKRPLEEELSQYNNVLLCIDKGTFNEDVEKADILSKIGTMLFDILSKYDFFSELDEEKIQGIYRISLDQVKEEFSTIEENSSSMSIEQEKARIKSKLNALRDPDTDEIIESRKEEYEQLRKQLVSLKVAKDAENKVNYSALAVAKFIPADKLSDGTNRTKILQAFADIKEAINGCIFEQKSQITSIVEELSDKINSIDIQISEIKREKNSIQLEIEQLNEEDSYLSYRKKQQEIRKEIVDFFVDFEILDEYAADDYAAAIDIISKRWEEIEKNQELLQQEHRSKIPMYKAIRDYLSSEENLEEDRVSYTHKLFENANVFGMTCTSRERFSEASMKALREYKLGDVNVRNVGVDVVIIDEVSKSSFLDLMIPILYGKTVVLVGDHRQLPPMYDLKHMRKDDFDGLDVEIIDYDLNKQYQALYENCFFKELFERVPSDYKIMLDKQYRCHSDIMDVFNHFYSTNGKGLSVGLSNQNDFKNHDLLVRNKKLTLIEPHNHIYFVNCSQYESHLDAESSSFVNRQEADVVCQLLKLMNEEYGRMIENGTLRRTGRKDERKSVGVICTYRDQARLIKNNLHGSKFINFSKKREERLIINTVDDFQGDERDIIIVSMVRNPAGNRFSTEFIDQFERINVALSRARCMLIVVGSQEFLSRSCIELPDINGNKALDKHCFPVYREIIRTIQAKGKLLQASDVIGEENKNGK